MDDQDNPRVSWRRLEFAGVAAIAVTVACTLIGQTAEHYAASLQPPPSEAVASRPAFNAIDYATTGALKSGLVVIGPCDTRQP